MLLVGLFFLFARSALALLANRIDPRTYSQSSPVNVLSWSSSVFTAIAKICDFDLWVKYSALGEATRSADHFTGSLSQSGPLHHSLHHSLQLLVHLG